jgi:lipopolysaccharide export system protein LptA
LIVIGAVGWWIACAVPPDRIAPARSVDAAPPISGLEVIVGAEPEVVRLSMAGAWVEEDGSGRGVDARAEIGGAPPLVVTGERSSWRLADGIVVFEGGVTATRGEVVVTCPRIEVRYQDERVVEARATGGVRVSRGERRAAGDQAVLTVADGRVTIDGGRPTVTDGPNTLSGERISLFLDDERLECEKCRLEVAGSAVQP